MIITTRTARTTRLPFPSIGGRPADRPITKITTVGRGPEHGPAKTDRHPSCKRGWGVVQDRQEERGATRYARRVRLAKKDQTPRREVRPLGAPTLTAPTMGVTDPRGNERRSDKEKRLTCFAFVWGGGAEELI